jgi:tRNA G26 N,N-dimethylase Trm1
LWCGPLHDKKFALSTLTAAQRLEGLDKGTLKILDTITDEVKLDAVGFIDIHELASRLGIHAPRKEKILEHFGVHVCRTHISPTGLKTDLAVEQFSAQLKKL